MKKVSVIIPCYNAAEWLPKCFVSLVSQTLGVGDMELIFVDDASEDGGETWNLLLEFERAYPGSIMAIHLEENMRQGGARNVALQYASGEYVAFVDADDFVSEDFLAKTYQRAKEENADIVQFEYFYYTDRIGAVPAGRSVKHEVLHIMDAGERKEFLVSEKITYGCWNKLYRTELVKRAGVRYAEHVIYEEPLFVYPLLFYGSTFVIMEDAFYFYRQNDSGTMRSDMKEEQTLRMHMQVQLAVWQFMKQTPFSEVYYEEIKLYFLHTYFYETLYFAKQRGFIVPCGMYRQMVETVAREMPDYRLSEYEALIPLQMELYRMEPSDMTDEKLRAYMKKI